MFYQYKCIADTDATNIKEGAVKKKSTKEPFPECCTPCASRKSEGIQNDTNTRSQIQCNTNTTTLY